MFPPVCKLPAVNVPEIVTAFGKPIVSVCPLATVSISFVVPAIVNDCVSKSTAKVPLSPAPSKSAASNALLICTTASITSVADAIVPDAPVILAISPTSVASSLNSTRNCSKVLLAATFLSAIFFYQFY